MPQPIDISARETAIDIQRSFAVTAPAGSGKTGLLTLRVLKLLSAVQQPEEVLCITFTNKAAQEMRERIMGALHEAAHLSADDLANIEDPHRANQIRLAQAALANDQKHGWKLIDTPRRLNIMTIDSFCRSITRQLPIMSELGNEPDILENPEKAYESATRQYIDNTIKQEDNTDFLELVYHLDGNLDRLSELLISLLKNRDQWLPIIYSIKNNRDDAKTILEENIFNWFSSILEKLQQQLTHYECEICELAQYAAKNLKEEKPDSPICKLEGFTRFPAPSLESIDGFWHPLTELFLTGKKELRKSFTKTVGFPAPGSAENKEEAKAKKQQITEVIEYLRSEESTEELLSQANIMPTVLYAPSQWRILSALIHELPRLTAFLRVAFSELSGTDFTEITTSAIYALANDETVSDLSLKLDYRLNHILIDEFQDTSYSQLQLLEQLTSEWLPGEPRSLYVVGDGMQSCYGFRNANVGIFLDLRKHGLPSVKTEPLDLSVNFRSRPEIIEWVNQVFIDAFPAQDNVTRGAVKYSPSHAFKTPAPEQAYVKCLAFLEDDERYKEAQYIAEEIQTLRAQHPDETIAVLAKNRSHLVPIIERMNDNGIPYQAIDIDPIATKQIIIDLISLTRALINFSDRIAWLALLRTPWCGITLPVIDELLYPTQSTNDDGIRLSQNIWLQIIEASSNINIQSEDQQRIARLKHVLQDAIDNRRRKSLANTIESAWFQLGGPTALNNASDITDIYTYFDLLAQYEKSGTIDDWTSFESTLNQLYAQPNHSGDNPVQFMTMHKSKGLEFDTVFLPALSKSKRSEDSELLSWHELIDDTGNKSIVVSPIAASTENTADPLTQFIRYEKKVKRDLEDLRLLYVACTRAKSRLYISAQLKEKEGAIQAPTKNSLLSPIWKETSSSFIVAEPEHPVSSSQAEEDTFSNKLERLPLSWVPAAALSTASTVEKQETPIERNQSLEKTPAYDSNTNIDVFTEFKEENPIQKAKGVLMHRILKILASGEMDHWVKTKIEQAKTFWDDSLLSLGVTEEKDRELVITELVNLIPDLLADEESRWVLNNQHRDSQCELKVFHHQYGQQIIDRTFIDETNTRWIIDYKSSTPKPGQDHDEFVSNECREYLPQLSRYAEVLRAEEPFTESINIALYFPFLRRLEKLEHQ